MTDFELDFFMLNVRYAGVWQVWGMMQGEEGWPPQEHKYDEWWKETTYKYVPWEWNDEEEVVLGIDKVFDKELVGELVDFITSLARWWASPGQFEEYGDLPRYKAVRSVLLVGSPQELQAPFDSHVNISAQLECIDAALETCSKIGMQVMQIDKTPGLLQRLADLRLKLTELPFTHL